MPRRPSVKSQLEKELAAAMGISLDVLYCKYVGDGWTRAHLRNWIEFVKARRKGK